MLGRSRRRRTSLPWWTDAAAFAGGLLAAGALWVSLHGGSGSHAPSAEAARPIGAGEEAVEVKQPAPASSSGSAPGKAQGASDKPPSRAAGTRGPVAATDAAAAEREPAIQVRVYLSKQGKIETVPLETYVRGVVAAEMPLSFEPAALEAQALAARTFIVRKMRSGDSSGVPVSGADTIDTQDNQAYRSLAEMESLKRTNPALWEKANEAAQRTKGQILTYGGEPIEALYFASSNGYTENSEDVFSEKVPYLRSVPSPWDRQEASDWETTEEIPLRDFYRELGVETKPTFAFAFSRPNIRITSWTPGRRVKTLSVGGQELSGEEARRKLGLRSAAFELRPDKMKVVVTSFGNGHGVGMSQWGAEGLAKLGRTAAQIVAYYYTGVRIESVAELAEEGKL